MLQLCCDWLQEHCSWSQKSYIVVVLRLSYILVTSSPSCPTLGDSRQAERTLLLLNPYILPAKMMKIGIPQFGSY